MPDTIMVSVLVRASWTPDLDGDVEYPTIEDYAARTATTPKAGLTISC